MDLKVRRCTVALVTVACFVRHRHRCHATVSIRNDSDDTKFKDDKYVARVNSNRTTTTDRMNHGTPAQMSYAWIGRRWLLVANESMRNFKSVWIWSMQLFANGHVHDNDDDGDHNQIEKVSRRLTQMSCCWIPFHFGADTQDVGCRCVCECCCGWTVKLVNAVESDTKANANASTDSNLSVPVEHTELVRVTNRI